MVLYFTINMLISLSALSIYYFVQIPYRLRFYCLMAALTCWIIPVHQISIELAPEVAKELHLFDLVNKTIVQYAAPTFQGFNWLILFYLAIVIGVIRFVFDIIGMRFYLNGLRCGAKSHPKIPNLMIVDGINNAFVSGYLRQTIWIDKKLFNSSSFQAIVIHEQQHIKQNDQLWLLFVHIIRRAFWFNPLILLLTYETKNCIELSCDEACKKLIGKRAYQRQLAKLMLQNASYKSNLLFNYMNKNNFNIKRIKKLNQENIMNYKKMSLLFVIAFITFSLSAYLLISVAHSENTKFQNQVQPKIEMSFNQDKWKIKLGKDYPYRNAMLNDIVYTDKIRTLKKSELLVVLGEPSYYRDNTNYLYYVISQTRLFSWPLHTKTLVIKISQDSTVEWIKIHK